jgi:hypothetical protein
MNLKVYVALAIAFVFAIGGLSSVSAAKATEWEKDISNAGFTHGTAFEIEGETYYMKGPGSIAGEIDVPGHTWVQAGDWNVVGKHYNVGPWFAPMYAPFWAHYEPWGSLLYSVQGIIDVPPEDLTAEEEMWYKDHGYVHIHEFVDMYGAELEDYVVYFKHTAVTEFMFNGGPMAPLSNHYVEPGVDYMFIPNW